MIYIPKTCQDVSDGWSDHSRSLADRDLQYISEQYRPRRAADVIPESLPKKELGST